MQTRWMLCLPLCVAITGPASAQGFAPAQARAAAPPPRPARMAATDPRPGTLEGVREAPLLNTGMPVPVPLGMADPAMNNGVISARVPTSGANVTLPPSAVANGVRLYSYTNAMGGLESVAYDPGTGATVVYDQTLTYSLQNRLDRFGQVPYAGTSSAAGIVNNPSFSLQPGRAVPDVGIPVINQASPSYNYQTNLGLGPSPSTFAPPPSPFSGSPLGTLDGGSGFGTASPFTGSPLGTVGAGSAPPSSPFTGTPLGTLGGTP